VSEFKTSRPRVTKPTPTTKNLDQATTKAGSSGLPSSLAPGQTPAIQDVLYLQRTIGNTATARLLAGQRKTAPMHSPETVQAQEHATRANVALSGQVGFDTPFAAQAAPFIIQRFPTAQAVKDRSDKKSNKSGIGKTIKKTATQKKGPSAYQQVITAVDGYNYVVSNSNVETTQKTRQDTAKAYQTILRNIRTDAEAYIKDHESKGDRPQTVTSFKTLLAESRLEGEYLSEIAGNAYYDNPGPPMTWLTAIQGRARGTSDFVIQVAVSIGLPPSFLRSLPNDTLELINSINILFIKGNARSANEGFTILKTLLPGGTFALVRTSIMRKHLDKLNPELKKTLDNPDFKQKEGGSNQLAGDFGLSNGFDANFIASGTSLERYKRELVATDAQIAAAATTNPDVVAGIRTAAEFIANFKARRKWESENLKLSDYEKLGKHEKAALSAYSFDFKQFNTPLRGDLTPGSDDQEGFSQTNMGMAQNLISALNKLPPYVGDVFRHDQDFPGFLEINRVGGTVSDMAFLSTTREANTLTKIVGSTEPDVLTILQSKTGRFIKPLSNSNSMSHLSKDENEVLFKPGTRFRIIARYDAKQDPTGGFYFPRDMDPKVRTVLSGDALKAQMRIILVKEEV
jgi:hypothetical protein